jgi:predicted DNA-binding protein with PD1-like motif
MERDNFKEEIMTHLIYIKERVDDNHNWLKKLNGRVRKNEIALSWMKGIGATVTLAISIILTYFKANK